MKIPGDLQRAVEARAGRRCEYCQMHQALQGATFHVEHVIPRTRKGMTALTNLALACPSCNLHKADRVTFADPESGELTPLFNPRNEVWADHFAWERYEVIARTAVGHATIAALQLNHPRRVQIRQAEELFSLFPPEPES